MAVRFAIAWTLSALLAGVAAAQENTATITGKAVDSSGAVIPSARVTAHNVQTGVDRQTLTSETGDYTIPLLPVGTYDVAAEKEGFKRSVKTGIVQIGRAHV